MIGEILDYTLFFNNILYNAPFEQYLYFCPVCSVKHLEIMTYQGDWMKARLCPENAWKIKIFAGWNN